jgi:hypothetical protein
MWLCMRAGPQHVHACGMSVSASTAEVVGLCTEASLMWHERHTGSWRVHVDACIDACTYRAAALAWQEPRPQRANPSKDSAHNTTCTALQVWILWLHSLAERLQLKRRSIAWRFWQWSVQDVNADVRRTYGSPGQKQQLSITLLFRGCKTYESNASIGSGARYHAYSATFAEALDRFGSSPGADAF